MVVTSSFGVHAGDANAEAQPILPPCNTAAVIAELQGQVRTLRRAVAASVAVAAVALCASLVTGTQGSFASFSGSHAAYGHLSASKGLLSRNEVTQLAVKSRSDGVEDEVAFKGCDSASMPPQMAPVRRSDDLFFLSGIVGYDVACKSVHKNATAQIDAAFSWATRTLNDIGTSWAEVLSVTSYHVGLGQHVKDFEKARELHLTPKLLEARKFPAWTSVGVTELYFQGEIIELSLVARAAPCRGLECDSWR